MNPDPQDMSKDTEPTGLDEGKPKNIMVNKDGTISPIDPSQPSSFTSDFSEDGVLRAILLNMEWCHAVKTESLEKTIELINKSYISRKEHELALARARRSHEPKLNNGGTQHD